MIRMIFEGEQLGDLPVALEPEWKAHTRAELVLIETRSHAPAWERIPGMGRINKTKGKPK